MNYKFAVIVLNYNNYKDTIKCVNSLKGISELKIFIVDNNSKNKSYNILKEEFLKEKNIDFIKSKTNLGYSGGNNLGILKILKNEKSIKYIGIINPDVVIKNKMIFQNLSKILEFKNNYMVVSPLMVLNNKLKIDKVAWKRTSNIYHVFENLYILTKLLKFKNYKNLTVNNINNVNISIVDALPGSFLFFKNEYFKKYGLLDENVFLYYEENILCEKLNDKEALILSLDDYYFHYHNKNKYTMKKRFFDFFNTFKSRLYFLKTYRKINLFIKFLLYLTFFIRIIEIPIISFFAFIMNKIKNLKGINYNEENSNHS